MNFREKVYLVTKMIPKGKVATYSQIAKMIGNPKSVRAVGNALNKNRNSMIPCHRVVCSDGKIGGFKDGVKIKIRKLMKEKVVVIKGRIDLKRYGLKDI